MKCHQMLLCILFLLKSTSASIRGAIRKMQRLVEGQVSDRYKSWKSLVVTNSCPVPIQSTLRFFDGNLKQIILETMSFQEETAILTDNAVTVALVAVTRSDNGTDVHAAYCSSNNPKYITKDDGLCYKYYFINSASSNHIDILCDVSQLQFI